MPHDPRVLVDYRTHDDAGVYRIDEQTAIVQTVDFFTPIVDDPFRYGQIAAANALSDVYAMGGKPITALAVAAFPSKDIDPRVIESVFAGGLSMLREAGVALLGGHTVRDQEIKFGYAVTGTVHPDRIWSNAGARVGDVLLLTKPIGTGIVTTAIKFGRAPQALADAAIASMSTLESRGGGSAGVDRWRGRRVHRRHRIQSDGARERDGGGEPRHAAAASRGDSLLPRRGRPRAGQHDRRRRDEPAAFQRGRRVDGETRFKASDAAAENLTSLLYDPQTSGGLLVSVDPGLLDPAGGRWRRAAFRRRSSGRSRRGGRRAGQRRLKPRGGWPLTLPSPRHRGEGMKNQRTS